MVTCVTVYDVLSVRIRDRPQNSNNFRKVSFFDTKIKLLLKMFFDGFNSNMVSKVCIGKHKSHMKHVFSFCEIKNFKKENYIKQIWNKGIFGVYKHSEETKNNMSNKRKGKKLI